MSRNLTLQGAVTALMDADEAEYIPELPGLREAQLLRLSAAVALWEQIADTLDPELVGQYITQVAGWVLWGGSYNGKDDSK